VQLAKLHGAEVTGVDHTYKLDFMRSLGADHVIDYTREDFTRNGKQYDLILDLIAHRSVFAYQRALRPNGTCFFVGGSVATLFQILIFGRWIKRTANKNLQLLIVPQSRKDLLAVTALCEAGQLTPMIDRRFALNEVPEAFRYIATGRAKGKIVIMVENSDQT